MQYIQFQTAEKKYFAPPRFSLEANLPKNHAMKLLRTIFRIPFSLTAPNDDRELLFSGYQPESVADMAEIPGKGFSGKISGSV